ncbi:gliding motility-associated ABC transporter substrate-binding protein GldG [Desertivirga xinjiangensis]|uniref:gliding motility-associated ABC transporter substrate-binding protein GldG n=1 Tax=Desertivirga xinjiangensis TaxID=539206 RepID=UPI00210B4BB7|nr:gliding motility-associated ABC transporter substrate-binding protein GldG [Pedobacter xinjiangensis]
MVDRKKRDLQYLALFIVILIAINIASSFVFTRFDFTAEKRYTLSSITKSELSDLSENIQVTVYLEGEFPSAFKRLRNSTKEILSEYKAYANGRLRFDFVNPLTGSQENQQTVYQELVAKGLEPTNLSVKTEAGLTQKIVFPAALITYQGKQIPVNLFQNREGLPPEEVLNNSIQNLEYAFTSSIKKITSGGKPRIGFTEGHGELSDLQLSDALNTLQSGYEAGRVDLKTIPFEGINRLKVLVIPKPDRPFTEAEKYKIDYFLMRGGSLFFAIDNVNAELDSLRGMGSQLAFAKKLNLDDMLFTYGVRVNYDLLADMNCAQIPVNVGNIAGQPQMQMVPWLFYPIFVPVSKHPLVKNLDGIRSEFANTVDTIAVEGIRKQVILSSSPYSRLLKIPNMISLEMIAQEPDPREFQSRPKSVGVLLEGEFTSNFRNRPVPEEITDNVTIPEKGRAARIIVVGDGDILKNQINTQDGSPLPLGYDRYTQKQYGNKNFLLNIADYLTDDSGIIELRNKEIRIRLLDRAKVRDEKLNWQLLNILLPLVLLTIFALGWHFYRKSRFAK